MSLWRQLTRGARVLTRRDVADRDLADEVEHYFEEATAAAMVTGLSREEARRAASVAYGNTTSVREQVRGYGWENGIETTLSDVRHAARKLRAEPGFTAITLLTLALGIGGTTAIFSAVNPILFEPLPYPEAERIAMVQEMVGDGSRIDGTFGMYRQIIQRARSFESLAVFRPWQPALAGLDQPERFIGQRVSVSYFRVLGVQPALGRVFLASEDLANGPGVVIISDALWQRRFNGDRAILGRELSLDGTPHVVVGVMPRELDNVLAPSADVWAPLQYDMTQGRAWGHHLRTVGRLHAGVSTEQATQELNAVGQAVLRELQPETYSDDVQFVAASLQEDVTRGVRPALLAVLGAVILVLVIACVNVTNLLLARGARRGGEFALRAALGAGRARLIRQLLTESVVLSAFGGLLGMAVALIGVRALIALSPPGLPRVSAIGVDATAFAFGLAVTTLIGLAFGIVPALQAARSDPNRDLQSGSRRMAGGNRRTRSALVVAEVAIALVLLVGSGLLLRSLERLFAVPVGFESSDLLTMQVQTSRPQFRTDTLVYRSFEATLDAVRSAPGVAAAGFTSQLPLSGERDEYGVTFESSQDAYSTFRYAVSPGYIETMRIPLRHGRLINDRDGAGTPLVALISESLAKRRFGGADAVGRRLRIGPVDGYTIVGVVGDVKQMSLALSESDAVYIPASQWPFADNAMSMVIRERDGAGSLAPALREAIWSVDPDQPILRVATMDELLARSAADRRFALIIFEAFALAALLLAAAGIYGVVSGSVTERTREIGLRSALGASRSYILALVLGQGLKLTALGVAIGLAAAAAASQTIAAMLFSVSPLDAVTYLGVLVLLIGVSIVACAVPAWRAARVDPAITLKAG